MKILRTLNFTFIVSISLVSLSACFWYSYKVKKPNVLILMLDTLRADHMSGWGYERNTTPELDKFAAENLKFSTALTTAPWTPPSIATILTGLYPSEHGMMPPNDRDIAKAATSKLPSSVITIAERLKDFGYRTAAISPNPWITKEFGYTQGFNDFHYKHRGIAEEINKYAIKVIEKFLTEKSKDPFFLYVHYFDPHDPYEPPGEYATKFKGPLSKSAFTYDERMLELIAKYDGEISYLDAQLGKLFAFLKAKDLYDDLFIVVVADHGEQFMEHGDLRHGFKLFNEEIHIPLIIRTGRKGDVGRVVSEVVSHIDIAPTILDRIGESLPKELSGISLLDDQKIKSRRGVMSEIRRVYDMKSMTNLEDQRLIMDVPYNKKNPDPNASLERWKTPNIIGIFDSRVDYACKAKTSNQGLENALKSSFDQTFASAQTNAVVSLPEDKIQVNDETLDQLKSLGYLQ